MKNILLIVALTFLISCDAEMDYEFSVRNNSKTEIQISFETVDGTNDSILIYPQGEQIIYSFTIIEGMHIVEREIESVFNSISVKNDTVLSNNDFLSSEEWMYKELSDTYASYLLLIEKSHFD